MQFSVALNDFQKHLQKVTPAVPSKSTLPVLEHFLIRAAGGAVTITATDLELTITATLLADVSAEGSALVPARKLTDIVKALAGAEGSVTFSRGEKYDITLKTGFGQYAMKGMSEDDFPELPDFRGDAETFFPAADIMRIADKTAFAVSTDEYKPAMTGVLLQFRGSQMKAAATDSYRLSRVIISAAEGRTFPDQLDVIIPARMAELLRKVNSDARASISRTHAQFTMDDATIITRLIDERFPAYENVIPADNDKMMVVNNRDIMAAIKRVSLFTNANSRQIRFVITRDIVTVRGDDDESGNHASEEVRCEFNQDDMEIGFNYKFVEEALQNMDIADTAAESVFLFSSPTRAALLKNKEDDDSLLMLIMPVRL
ncbi:DNA polymerase III subunit beta [Ignavibacteria bacterium]|nr:DNA polymerase III subunit beta [Bacteroidota bacterium]MCZ2132383.1 DNA polymerase III subunit beta [Bacteroidota bacterium]